VKYAFIRDHAKRWPVVHMCRLLGVKRSSYYDWRKRPAQVIPAEELALYAIHGALHLVGYDDKDPAERRRIKPVKRIGIPAGAAGSMW